MLQQDYLQQQTFVIYSLLSRRQLRWS